MPLGLGDGVPVQEHSDTGRSLRSLGSPLNAQPLGGAVRIWAYPVMALIIAISTGCGTTSSKPGPEVTSPDLPKPAELLRRFCAETSTVGVEGDVVAPRLLKRVEPEYPLEARRQRLAGAVILAAAISKQGAVESVRVLSSLDPIFSEAAVAAVRQWRYQAATLHGEPLEVCFAVRMDFHTK